MVVERKCGYVELYRLMGILGINISTMNQTEKVVADSVIHPLQVLEV